jgi:FkbH-like protein
LPLSVPTDSMTLNQALALIKSRKDSGGEECLYHLVCGFEPLHLKTLLHAHLLERLPTKVPEVRNGMYGDLPGNLARAEQLPAAGAAVILEWGDIDPRLGLRSSGGWSEDVQPEILASVRQRFLQIELPLGKLAGRMPAAVVVPSLPLLAIGNTVRAQASVIELELEQELASFLVRIARLPGVRVIQRSQLDRIPSAERLDPRMELLAGFPYTLPFADVLASSVTDVLNQPPPMKGLITDLDDTFWSGIVGEVGAEGVSWHQESHTQAHGLYQQMLGNLASCGVLLAVCSKNEISTVETALARQDLLLKSDSLYPVCANWGPKSESIARILRTWNIAEDAVVFVDDSPMELDEVKERFPGITCRRFTGKDPVKVWQLIGDLRDLFGKPLLMEEDRLRQSSIRAAAQIQEMGESAGSPEFLRRLNATITLDWRRDPSEKRPLELVNKTNQFNLNGRRIEEAEWRRCLDDSNAMLAVVSYTDKFGPLGRVAVVLGTRNEGTISISHWVMSCRAFSRAVEHHTLAGLLQRTEAEAIEFAFEATAKNKPLQEFFRNTGIHPDSAGKYRLSRATFPVGGDALPHKVLNL